MPAHAIRNAESARACLKGAAVWSVSDEGDDQGEIAEQRERLDHDVWPLLLTHTADPGHVCHVVCNAELVACVSARERRRRCCVCVRNHVQPMLPHADLLCAGCDAARDRDDGVCAANSAKLEAFIEAEFPAAAGEAV
jgi:hypothetical protein